VRCLFVYRSFQGFLCSGARARRQNPEKYKALLSKYFAKRRQKQENEETKNVLKKQDQKPGEKEAEEK
jgi:hypothetical protein